MGSSRSPSELGPCFFTKAEDNGNCVSRPYPTHLTTSLAGPWNASSPRNPQPSGRQDNESHRVVSNSSRYRHSEPGLVASTNVLSERAGRLRAYIFSYRVYLYRNRDPFGRRARCILAHQIGLGACIFLEAILAPSTGQKRGLHCYVVSIRWSTRHAPCSSSRPPFLPHASRTGQVPCAPLAVRWRRGQQDEGGPPPTTLTHVQLLRSN